jgi:Cu+-exporting ATPase
MKVATEAVLEVAVRDRGIHCAGCESRIEGVLGRLPGVHEVKADHRTQRVTLRVDPGVVSARDVLERLARIGFAAAEA